MSANKFDEVKRRIEAKATQKDLMASLGRLSPEQRKTNIAMALMTDLLTDDALPWSVVAAICVGLAHPDNPAYLKPGELNTLLGPVGISVVTGQTMEEVLMEAALKNAEFVAKVIRALATLGDEGITEERVLEILMTVGDFRSSMRGKSA